MLPVQTRLPVRLFVLAWLITWITSVPLFHIHIPDTTDRWSLLHSGGAHTVFTPDLPGEFSQPFIGSHVFLSKRGVNSPELGIVLFDEKSKDRKSKALNILGAPYLFLDIRVPSLMFASPGQHRKLHLPQTFPASRAPPRIVFFS